MTYANLLTMERLYNAIDAQAGHESPFLHLLNGMLMAVHEPELVDAITATLNREDKSATEEEMEYAIRHLASLLRESTQTQVGQN